MSQLKKYICCFVRATHALSNIYKLMSFINYCRFIAQFRDLRKQLYVYAYVQLKRYGSVRTTDRQNSGRRVPPLMTSQPFASAQRLAQRMCGPTCLDSGVMSFSRSRRYRKLDLAAPISGGITRQSRHGGHSPPLATFCR